MIKNFFGSLFLRFIRLLFDMPVPKGLIASLVSDEYKKLNLHVHKIWGEEDRLILGDNVHLNNAMINTVSGCVYIGDDTFLGHGVSLLTGTHDYRKTGLERQIEVPNEGRDIIIGKGVWIASNALIIGPCEIRDNSVIAANSVITGVVEEGMLVSTIGEIKKKKIKF